MHFAHSCMTGLGEACAQKAAWYFAFCGDFWNKWKQCIHKIYEQATELITCNVAIHATRLSVETNVHVYMYTVYRWGKASFVLDPKCV